jgi:hypothetical protein
VVRLTVDGDVTQDILLDELLVLQEMWGLDFGWQCEVEVE